MKNSAVAYLDDYSSSVGLIEPTVTMPKYGIAKDAYEQVLGELLRWNTARGASQLLEVLVAKLDEISSLRENWDSYGAPAPNPETIRLSKSTLKMSNLQRALPSTVVASAEGGVALCWDLNSKHAYIEFGNDGTAIVATYAGSAEPYIEEFSPDTSLIGDALTIVRDFMRS